MHAGLHTTTAHACRICLFVKKCCLQCWFSKLLHQFRVLHVSLMRRALATFTLLWLLLACSAVGDGDLGDWEVRRDVAA